MTRASRQRTDLEHAHERVRKRHAWGCCAWQFRLIAILMLFALTASVGAMQQAGVVQDSLQPEAVPQTPVATPPATRGISAQAANEAVTAELKSSSEAEQQEELQETEAQDKQAAQNEQNDSEQQASARSESDAAEVATQPSASLSAASPDAVATPPIAVGATRGVLFRIFPPEPTTLPAEIAISGTANTAAVSEANTANVEEEPESALAPASPKEISSEIASPTAALEPVQAKPSYLLGTIHFGTPEEQGIDYAILETALADVDTFVNEANLDEAWHSDYDDYRWLPSTQPLSAMVSKDSYAMARSLLPNIRAQDLLRMKPWSVLALLEARGETGGDTTMDARLQRIATASGKRLVHLETLQQQLQALDCVPATEQASVLDERLRAPWILRDESAAAMGYYRSRNLDAWLADIDHMYGLSYAGRAIEQRSRHCLLEERNARWVGQLETLFQDGPSFVAVGAVHLVGAEGLLAILRRDGYRIEEVPL